MKTRFKIGVLMIILGVFIYINAMNNRRQSGALYFNVEALANGEEDSDGECFYVGSVDCPFSQAKVYIVY